MGEEYARGLWGDAFFYFGRVGIEGLRVYVGKDGGAVLPHYTIGGGRIAEGGSDDLVVQFQRLYGYLYGYGAIAQVEQMLYIEVFFQFQLQVVNERTIIGEPFALPYTLQVGDVFFDIGQERLSDVYHNAAIGGTLLTTLRMPMGCNVC